MPLATSTWRPLFQAFADHFELPPWGEYAAAVWLEAVACHESSGNPHARHYDSGRDPSDKGPSELWASWGLMQIEGVTAQALFGHCANTQDFSFLYEPALNIWAGAFVLNQNLHRYAGSVDKAIAAYNLGHGENPDGSVADQPYVDAVKAWLDRVHADQEPQP